MNREDLQTIVVTEKYTGLRLDRFLHELYPEIAVNRWRRKLAGRAAVLVDGRPGSKGLRLAAGQKVVFAADLPEELMPAGPLPETGPLAVLYRDANLLAVNKPSGCHTHPLRPGETGTLVNRLLFHFPEILEVGGFNPLQPGLLNRLDRATSGVVLVALDPVVWKRVRTWFATHRIRKEYLAEVQGCLEEYWVVENCLTHDSCDSRRMVVSPPAPVCRGLHPARTEIFPLAYREVSDTTLVCLSMRTGVMHQLRVHLAEIGHPLVGDILYGGRRCDVAVVSPVSCGSEEPVPFFHLHCHRIILPEDGPVLEAPPPAWAKE